MPGYARQSNLRVFMIVGDGRLWVGGETFHLKLDPWTISVV